MEKKAIVGAHAFSCLNDINKIVFLDNAKNARNKSIYHLGNVESVVAWNDKNNDKILYVAPTIGNKIYIGEYATYLFYHCTDLKEIVGIDILDTSISTNMTAMFCGCKSLASLDLSSFDTRNIVSMRAMFSGCHNLSNLDVSSFDTSKVTDMSYMFAWCDLRKLNLSGFNTHNVTNMAHMFYWCDKLISLDLSSFDTSNVKNMDSMFFCCKNLKSLDLSRFDMSSIQCTNEMFYGCKKNYLPYRLCNNKDIDSY